MQWRLSAVAYVCNAALLHEGSGARGAPLQPHGPLAEPDAWRALPAGDGSLWPALLQMAWAWWQDAQQRAATIPVAVAGLRQMPVAVTVTAGNAPEREAWRRLGQPGGFEVCERG